MHKSEPSSGEPRDHAVISDKTKPSGLPYTQRGTLYTAVSRDCPSWIHHNGHVPVLPSARTRHTIAASTPARRRPCSAPSSRQQRSNAGQSNDAGASARAPWMHLTHSLAPTSPASVAVPSPEEREGFLLLQQHLQRRKERERHMGFRAWTAHNGRVKDARRAADIRAARSARNGTRAHRGHFVPPQRAQQEGVAAALPGMTFSTNPGSGLAKDSAGSDRRRRAPSDVVRATQRRLAQLEDEISSVQSLAWHKLTGE